MPINEQMATFLKLFFKVKVDYTEEVLAISSYPLSAALTCAKICTAFEQEWDVL